MPRIVGIDLGTTNSVLAVMEHGAPSVVRIDGQSVVPSVVGYGDGSPIAGRAARNRSALNPASTVRSVKRLMGRRRREATDEEAHLPYALVGEPDELVRIRIGDSSLTPSQVSAEVLRFIKSAGERVLGEPITDAVITVPAYFNDTQRQATKAAGRIAGLKVRRIVSEPTAAALAYGLDDPALDARVAVYDLGGGTFDVSILSIKDGVFEVLATNGNTRLGGDDFDTRIVEWALGEIRRQKGVTLSEDPVALQRLRIASEEAKCQLSSALSATIRLPFVGSPGSEPVNVELELTRDRFETLIADLVAATRRPCRKALSDAGLSPSDIDDVLLVGGSTRIPAVRQCVRDAFDQEPNTSINPDEAVALGAAIQAGILERAVENVLLLDVTPLSLGIETYGGVMSVLIPRNTTIPTSKSELFSTFVDDQTVVDIHVVQGERELVRDNRTLARFQLTGIPPMPKGVPQIDVAFDLDANGILNVRASERLSRQEVSVEVASSGDLTEEQVNRLVQESLAHAEEDVSQRMLIEARVEARGILDATWKALAQYGNLIDVGERDRIKHAAEALEDASESTDTHAIRDLIDKLNKETLHLADVMVAAVVRQELPRSGGEPPSASNPTGRVES